MNVVGRVGSIISQGVYSVATPFHPFGGAVDIIVVEQEDGTYRSTPWYVRFGKFQGVLKGAEKVVTIAVNGDEANFHMYLDSSGEAYFLKEVVSGTNDDESTDQVLNESNHLENKLKHPNCSHSEKFEDYMGDLNENKEQVQEDVQLREDESTIGTASISNRFNSYNYANLEEVEDVVESSNDANSEMVLISVDGHVLTAPISASDENMENLPLDNPQFHLGPGEGPGEEFVSGGDMWEDGLYVDMESRSSKETGALENPIEVPKDCKGVSLHGEHVQSIVNLELSDSSETIAASIDKEVMFKSCLDLTLHVLDSGLQDVGTDSQDSEAKINSKNSPDSSSFNTIMVREASTKDNETDLLSSSNVDMKDLEKNTSHDSKLNEGQIVPDVAPCNSNLLSDHTLTSVKNVAEASEKSLATDDMTQESSVEASGNTLRSGLECASERHVISATEAERNQTHDQGLESNISGLGFEISLCGNLLRHGMGHVAAEEAFNAHRVSEDEFKTSGQSIVNNGNLIVRYKEMYLPWNKVANLVVGKALYGSGFLCEISDQIPVDLKEVTSTTEDLQGASLSSTSSRRWRLWPIPFRRSQTLPHTTSEEPNEDIFVDTEPSWQNPHNEQNPISPRKQHLRTYIPTIGQIASLNLKDGQNMVAFSFSTRVLGKQQVDAHIYLWKWNARIVISDVDGTITKSDVLGQVMPLVGKDWTQSGVARLFSAIKENGYQLLFLSARAIVQAYLTRSFLLNLKQDGKALPSGPVVISPDGLFPSLFREVIRRAPHEFKIACLEDIRALFPSDYNPFYAGFGNRDTDELSYRKIGIAKGKIFIINPKGEVAINHCIDVKSYTSLHTLVNDMFPPTSLVEQEDFNSWNYWKIPLPSIDS